MESSRPQDGDVLGLEPDGHRVPDIALGYGG